MVAVFRLKEMPMQRRLFALMAVLAPFSALAQTTPEAPAAPATPAAPAAPHKRLAEKSWEELTPRQRTRLLHGFGDPAPSAEEARTRWEGMNTRQRRTVVRTATRWRRQHHG
jgi:hypothetical protein